jgi:hypothetical protein
MGTRRKDAVQEAAAAAAAAAVAATAEGVIDDAIDIEAAELTEDVLEGLRRLDQGGQRVTWYVYCDAPIEREGFVEKLRTEQLDESRFKTKYGPGEYRVIGRTGDGHYVKGSHKTIKISGILASEERQANDAVALLREMRAADEQRDKQRAETLKTYATILATPLATLGAALIARKPTLDIPALITALRPQQSSLTEMTTALTHLKAMEGGASNNNVELVLKLLERLQDLPTAGDTGWLGIVRDVIREAAPAAREMLGQLTQQQRGVLPAAGPPLIVVPPHQQPQAASPSQANGATQTSFPSAPLQSSPTAPPSAMQTPMPSATPMAASTTVETAEPSAWAFAEPWLRRKAEDLFESATSNMPVELCAEHLLESAERKFGMLMTTDQLRGLLVQPDWWQYVVAFHPPLEPFRSWVNDVRQEMVGMLASGRDESARSESQGEQT